MSTIQIMSVEDIPPQFVRAWRAAQAVGLYCALFDVVGELLLLGGPHVGFDPDNNTHHALLLLVMAQQTGFLTPVSEIDATLKHLCVRVVTGDDDTRVQVGAGRWYVEPLHGSPERAFRRAIVSAFEGHYVQITQPR